MEVFLHVCCAPCSIKCIDVLESAGFKPTLFWYNPNIHPWKEYESRRNTLMEYAKNRSLELILNDIYGLRKFVSEIYAEHKPKRCERCYEVRLESAANEAKKHGCEYFSTTLLISPYQNHELIHEIGNNLAKKYSIKFLYKDFRPYFREGQKEARAQNMYMQKYCGCVFSEEERYVKY